MQSLMMASMETMNPMKQRDMMLTRNCQYSFKSSQLGTNPSTDRKASLKFSVYSGELESNIQVSLVPSVKKRK